MRVIHLRMWGLAALLSVMGGRAALGQVICVDSVIYDDATKVRVQGALDSLAKNEADVGAMDLLVKQEARAAGWVGTSEIVVSEAPVRKEALAWLREMHSARTDLAAIEKGSDTTAIWGMREAGWCAENGKLREKEKGQVVEAVSAGVKRWGTDARAEAMSVLGMWKPEELKAYVHEKDETVAAAVIEACGNNRDEDIDEVVEGWMPKATLPAMKIACCDYWWLVKTRTPIKASERDMALFTQWAASDSREVRCAVARAVEGLARPDNPRMVHLLLGMTKDKDALVRSDATRALGNANTPEVNAALVALLKSKKSGLQSEALEMLGGFGEKNEALIVTTARSDGDPQVRRDALYYVRQIGGPDAGAVLQAAMKDPSALVRDEAATQLKWYKSEQAAKAARGKQAR